MTSSIKKLFGITTPSFEGVEHALRKNLVLEANSDYNNRLTARLYHINDSGSQRNIVSVDSPEFVLAADKISNYFNENYKSHSIEHLIRNPVAFTIDKGRKNLYPDQGVEELLFRHYTLISSKAFGITNIYLGKGPFAIDKIREGINTTFQGRNEALRKASAKKFDEALNKFNEKYK